MLTVRATPDHATRVYNDVFEMLPSPENPSPMVRVNRLNPHDEFTLFADTVILYGDNNNYGMTETAQRGGHIPGATSVPWSKAVAEDGTFKQVDQLRQIYLDDAGVEPDKATIAYCRYDGSWTEYGNVVDIPIERTAPAAVGAA